MTGSGEHISDSSEAVGSAVPREGVKGGRLSSRHDSRRSDLWVSKA